MFCVRRPSSCDQPYHHIAFEAYIDNPNVMHHPVAFSCEDLIRREEAGLLEYEEKNEREKEQVEARDIDR